MSSSLEDIWSQPLGDALTSPTHAHTLEDQPDGPLPSAKRSRSSLFLPGSDDESETQRRLKSSKGPDIDYLFDNLDEELDTTQSFDVNAFRHEARLRVSEEESQSLTPRALQSSSPPPGGIDENGQENGKENGKYGKKEKKPVPRLDEARLLDKRGFPALIQQSKAFTPKGKGHEVSDLNRLMTVYQFWAQRMYPKIQFSDTVDRVEKLCRQRRMDVALSVWRDEAKGTSNGVQMDEDLTVDATSDHEMDAETSPSSPVYGTVPNPLAVPLVQSYPISPAGQASREDLEEFDINALLAQEEELTGQHPVSRAEPLKLRAAPIPVETVSVDDDDEFWNELDELQSTD